MANTPPEDKFYGLVKLFVSNRKRPALLLSLDTVSPYAVIFVADALRDKQFAELDVILQTPGGHIESAYKIIKLLRQHSKKINVIVPSYAKSAGTLICLSGNTIVLTTMSELGPLDVQIPEQQDGDVDRYKSALNGYKALEQIRSHAIENLDLATKLIEHRTRGRMRIIDTLKLAIEFSSNTSGRLYDQIHPKSITEYARALDVGEQYGVRILTRYMGWETEKATTVVRKMVYDYPSHEFIIDREELTMLGLPVESETKDIDDIMCTMGMALMTRQTGEQEVKLFEFTETTPAVPTIKGQKKKNDKTKK